LSNNQPEVKIANLFLRKQELKNAKLIQVQKAQGAKCMDLKDFELSKICL